MNQRRSSRPAFRLRPIAWVASAMLAASTAAAQSTVTVDFDTCAETSLVNTQFVCAGIAEISSTTGTPEVLLLDTPALLPSTPTLQGVFTIRLVKPASRFSLEVHAAENGGATLEAFDAAGGLLGSATTTADAATLEVTAAGIASVVATSNNPTETWLIDNLSFDIAGSLAGCPASQCDNPILCNGDEATGDIDLDFICADQDACIGDNSTGDADSDGICDDQDACAGDDGAGDADLDFICADQDVCIGNNSTGDGDSDGVCDDQDACTGDDGTGDADADGLCDDLDLERTLIRTTPFSGAEGDCTAGGVRIDVGVDDNADSVLAADEIAETTFVCHGADGSPGNDGGSALVRTRAIAAGDDDCPAGGTRVEAGLDDDGNGALADAEVDSAAVVCAGRDGFVDEDGDASNCAATGTEPILASILTLLCLLPRRRRRQAEKTLTVVHDAR